MGGGLGRPWAVLKRLLRLVAISQALSPLVAVVVVVVASSTATTVDSPPSPLTSSSTPPPVQEVGGQEGVREERRGREGEGECCAEEAPCPKDYPTPSPQQLEEQCGGEQECTDPSLPLACLACTCPYSCTYGQPATATCRLRPGARCRAEGAAPPEEIRRQFTCSYCYLTPPAGHSCTGDVGCRSVGSPTSNQHWYIANCTSGPGLVCLGKQVFSKRVECNWTEGYSWTTAIVLSVTLGGFGADRFYLGHWQEGIGKLFSFGGLGVWTLVDVVLLAIGYIGPADGSLYI